MPYKDLRKQRDFQNFWYQHRRKYWTIKNGPCQHCGTKENLQAVHRDPSEKVAHRIWSWSEERREKELAKCFVLCDPCTRAYQAQFHVRGEDSPNHVWTEEQVREIKTKYAQGGYSYASLAREYTRKLDRIITKTAIRDLIVRYWKHVQPEEPTMTLWVGGAEWKIQKGTNHAEKKEGVPLRIL